MHELDVVKLKKAYHGIPAGTVGTIVLEYDATFFEVEFIDESGDTIDVLTVPVDVLACQESL